MFGSTPSFTTADIPSQAGRVALVTGGNTGLGKHSIITLSRSGAKVYLCARNEAKARTAIAEIYTLVPSADITFLALDLTSFASIAACANAFLAAEPTLHILMNNAGIMATPLARTAEGYEIQFGTNHMGHFLLTRLLLPALADGARVVNLASIGHNAALWGIQLPDVDAQLVRITTWGRYSISKLANILHARELARRYPKITAVAVHPGVIVSALYESFDSGNALVNAGYRLSISALRLVGKTPEEGALGQVYCAVMPVESGEYYVPVGRKARGEGWWHEGPTKWARSDELAKRLWDWSEEEVKKHGY